MCVLAVWRVCVRAHPTPSASTTQHKTTKTTTSSRCASRAAATAATRCGPTCRQSTPTRPTRRFLFCVCAGGRARSLRQHPVAPSRTRRRTHTLCNKNKKTRKKGRPWPGNPEEAEGLQETRCYDDGRSLRVRVVDSCPCTQVCAGGGRECVGVCCVHSTPRPAETTPLSKTNLKVLPETVPGVKASGEMRT